MPKFLEDKLKREYGANSAIPYKVMNAIGAMHGNKETETGREMEKKHMAKAAAASSVRRIEIHPADNGGHTVETHFNQKKGKSPAFSEYEEPKKAVFGADEHEKMIEHVREHLGIDGGDEGEEKAPTGTEEE